jgi:hypothetical protein
MKSPFPPLSQQYCGACRYRVEGQCRRHSPPPLLVREAEVTESLSGSAPLRFLAVWPDVDVADWCGDWTPTDDVERLALAA